MAGSSRTRPPTTSSSATEARSSSTRSRSSRTRTGRRGSRIASSASTSWRRSHSSPIATSASPACCGPTLTAIPLDLASQLLPWRTRLNFGLLSHLHLHARAQRALRRSDRGGRPGGSAHADHAPAAGGAHPQPARHGRAAALEPGRHRVVRLRRQHLATATRATADKARLVGEFVRAAPGSRGLGPGRQHRALQSDRRRCRQAGHRLRHRPGGGGAELPPGPPRGSGGHPAAHPRRREPEPGHRLGGSRAPLAAGAGGSRHRPRPGPRPPRRHLAQRAAADGARTCSPTWRPTRSSSSCPRRTRWSAALLASRARRVPRLHARGLPGGGRRAVRGRSASRPSRTASASCSCSAVAERRVPLWKPCGNRLEMQGSGNETRG